MKQLILVVLGMLFPMLSLSQQSDLEVSTHSIRYFGNEERLKRLIEPLRVAGNGPIVPLDDLCQEEVYEIGEIVADGKKYWLIYEVAGIGHSCRAVSNLLLFEGKRFYGYYRTDLIFKFEVIEDTLVMKYERPGKEERISFKEGVPEILPLEGLSGLMFQKYEKKDEKDK